MSFAEVLDKANIAELVDGIDTTDRSRVESALVADQADFSDFLALISPAAEGYLEEIAQKARSITLQRFGRIVLLYAPLYLSNECTNSCLYCGFNVHRKLPRITLTPDEALAEAEQLRQFGFAHVLLVCGEAPKYVPVSHLETILHSLRNDFPSLSLEIYPLSTSDYAQLIEAGADGLTLYQETYDRDIYAQVHPSGRKHDFNWRLGAAERAGEVGFRRLGIGSLLGLNDWKFEAVALALHADYLMKRFWKTQVTISFPRLRYASNDFQIASSVNDTELVQMMLALRILHHDTGFVISTREPASLRDRLIPLGVTQMSAGSRTEPGGYLNPAEEGSQFTVDDNRPPSIVAASIIQAGYEPVWKDWDRELHERSYDADYNQWNAKGSS